MRVLFKNKKLQDLFMGVSVATVGLLLFFAGQAMYQQFQLNQELIAPISKWITIDKFYVDGTTPDEPTVFFERTLRKDLEGTWTVNVINKITGKTACTGTGNALYLQSEKKSFIYSLARFINVVDCRLMPNETYILDANWFMVDAATGLTKPLWAESNEFVFAPS